MYTQTLIFVVQPNAPQRLERKTNIVLKLKELEAVLIISLTSKELFLYVSLRHDL